MKNIINKIFDAKHRSRTFSYILVIACYILVEVLMSTGNITSLLKGLLVPLCCYIVAALALNLVVGVSGELSLGQAGFMSIGAFSAVCVAGYLGNIVANDIVRLIIAMIVGAIVAAVFGFIIGIPVLKLQGDYLAIVTLAFGQIIKSVINNMYVGFDNNGFQFSFVTNNLKLGEGAKILLNGPMGATGTSRISTFTVGVILIIISLIVIYNLMYSKNGRAIMACRDNRIAASTVGINIANTKMLAFVISAALAGAAGALYALNYATLVPAKFDFNTSILILGYVVLGGLGNMNGTIISTVVLLLLPELLRSLRDYRMLIYAIVLIVIMIVTNNSRMKTIIESFKKKISGKGVKAHD